MKITISSRAEAFELDAETLIEDPRRLAKLNGTKFSDESCIDYFGDESLYEIGIIGGEIELRFFKPESELLVVTTYHTARKLNKNELAILVEETVGQWSDGIGEGEFQFADKFNMGVDVYPASAEEPSVEQIKDEVKVAKPKANDLIKAIAEHQDECMAISLIRQGAAVSTEDRHGNSALQLASAELMPDLVDLMLRRGSCFGKGSQQLADALVAAVSAAWCENPKKIKVSEKRDTGKSKRIAESLINAGAKIDALSTLGMNALMAAANNTNIALIDFLLAKGADINAKSSEQHNKCTVIMFASHFASVEHLLKLGADPTIRSSTGEDAYERQLLNDHQYRYKAIAAMIKEYM